MNKCDWCNLPSALRCEDKQLCVGHFALVSMMDWLKAHPNITINGKIPTDEERWDKARQVMNEIARLEIESYVQKGRLN